MKLQEKQEVKQEFNLKEAFVLWKQEAKSGSEYLSGFTSERKAKLKGFFNSKKKNPNEPDVRIYVVNEDGKLGIEVASLWEQVNDTTGKRRLTGYTNEKEKLIAFYGKENQEARPYIRAYYK